jgi:hypothetical protein
VLACGLGIAAGIASGCSAAGVEAPSGGPNASGGSAVDGSGGAQSFGGVGIDVTVDGSAAGSSGGLKDGWWIPADLPAPWAYYNEAGAKGYKDSLLPSEARDWFSGTTTTAGAPSIVYPLDAAMHPVNQGAITFQWWQGDANNTVFRIDATGANGTRYGFYVPCDTSRTAATQCVYDMPESDWLWMAVDNIGRDVTFTVSGSSGPGAAVATSPAVRGRFSPEPVLGALYYWAAQAEVIKRASFGARKAVAFIEPNSDTNQFACAGCHAVSRNGKVIAFGVTPASEAAIPAERNGDYVQAIQVAPTSAPTQPYVGPAKGPHGEPLDHFGHNVALSPDGSLAVINRIPADDLISAAPYYESTTWPQSIELRGSESGNTLAKYNRGHDLFGADSLPIFPEFSPNGSSIVASLDTGGWTYLTWNARIAVLPITNSTLGAPRIVAAAAVPDGFLSYPSWSPDGKWLVYQGGRAPGNSMHDEKATLFMSSATGGPYTCPGSGCIELSTAVNHLAPGNRLTWPKFTPFAQGDQGDLMFVSVTSRRPYGFLANNSSQIWMFAIDVARVRSGEDPSFAPIWLPEQEYSDGSLGPYWTEVLPCEKDADGGCSGCVAGEECVVTSLDECECRALPVVVK